MTRAWAEGNQLISVDVFGFACPTADCPHQQADWRQMVVSAIVPDVRGRSGHGINGGCVTETVSSANDITSNLPADPTAYPAVGQTPDLLVSTFMDRSHRPGRFLLPSTASPHECASDQASPDFPAHLTSRPQGILSHWIATSGAARSCCMCDGCERGDGV